MSSCWATRCSSRRIYEPGGKRLVYLPRGIWTNLETNEVFQGKRTIAVETKSLPVFARNGSIVPLDSAAGLALHYFPQARRRVLPAGSRHRRLLASSRRPRRRHHAPGDRVPKRRATTSGWYTTSKAHPGGGSGMSGTAKRFQPARWPAACGSTMRPQEPVCARARYRRPGLHHQRGVIGQAQHPAAWYDCDIWLK